MAQINKPSLHFNTKLYTGTGSSNAITGIGFQPDFVWIKKRNGSTQHALFDALRGTGKYLESSSTAPDQTDNNSLSAFGTDGFTVISKNSVNTNSDTYVSWNWKAANSSGSANSDGATASTVSANTTSGFSIVRWTGTGSATTIGHGLGAVPGTYIVKNLSTNSLQWRVYHHQCAGEPSHKHLALESTQALGDAASVFNDTEPTSTVFSVGSDDAANKSGDNMIAYVFAEKKGFSKFGRYIGNADGNGPYAYTGFKPAFLLIKNTVGTENWHLYDNKRGGPVAGYYGNLNKYFLQANTSNTESNESLDIYFNGFKPKITNAFLNGNGNIIVYWAFAENPLIGTNNINATAR